MRVRFAPRRRPPRHRRHRRGRPTLAAVAGRSAPGTPVAAHAGLVQGDRCRGRPRRRPRPRPPSRRSAACCRAGAAGSSSRCPATEQRLRRTRCTPAPAQYDGIAAVTTSADGSRSGPHPCTSSSTPRSFLPLGPRGAQVVVTHEATHVATAAATSTSPTWLVEGFADYVALRSQRLPLATSASRIIALRPRHGAPAHLPGAAAVRSRRSPHLEARYESAWLACRLLADDGGPRSLVAFYRGGRRRASRGGRAAPTLRPRRRRADPAVADAPVTLAGVSERRWAVVTFLVATVAFVAVAAWRIPWHPVPGGTPPPGRGRRASSPRPSSPGPTPTPTPHVTSRWASLAVSLLVALVLGLHPARARAWSAGSGAGGGCGCCWRCWCWP